MTVTYVPGFIPSAADRYYNEIIAKMQLRIDDLSAKCAAPAPQLVAVKALREAEAEFNLIACEGVSETRSASDALERVHFFANRGAVAIQSALSSPTGGTEELKQERVPLSKEQAVDAALDFLRKNGWKPGDKLSGHSVSQLMGEFAVMVDRGEIQCGWPDCGCCADAACRDAVAAIERASGKGEA